MACTAQVPSIWCMSWRLRTHQHKMLWQLLAPLDTHRYVAKTYTESEQGAVFVFFCMADITGPLPIWAFGPGMGEEVTSPAQQPGV